MSRRIDERRVSIPASIEYRFEWRPIGNSGMATRSAYSRIVWGLRGLLLALATILSSLVSPLCLAQTTSFVAFESGHVRPLALAPDGGRLFVVNTPDNRLEIFDVSETGLTHAHSVVVGMEPVAVAARGNYQVWVVNHLSDSVSVVQLSPDDEPPQVVETLLVGDEPRDIVFAGPGGSRAFVTTAHRGQNSPVDFLPFESQGRADVWIFDANDVSAPASVLTMFGDTPRALAVSPAGDRVYAAVFHSGNKTTALATGIVDCDMPPPFTNVDGIPAPCTGLILRFDGSEWVDAIGRVWSDSVRLSLPDWDVFAIDAMTDPPQEINRVSGVGTTLFNMAVNPVSGHLYVANTEAMNHIRFEGPGDFGGTTVRGHFVESRITVIDGAQVRPRHLNKHIDYDKFPGTNEDRAKSLATPLDMAVSSDGSALYVAAFGSRKVGVFDVNDLEDDSFTPSPASHISITGGGPSGLALDEARQRLYVLTRFDNAISIIDLSSNQEVRHISLYNPEPASVIDGRRFLYDARLTSSRGDSSCGGCHIFGDTDHLTWNLGNPDGVVLENRNLLTVVDPPRVDYHPMKGPMATQSLRGLSTHGPMHWRGDRSGGNQPGASPLDEEAAFKTFNVAFEGLLGRTSPLTAIEMQQFTDFILQITYPANPVRALDNSLDESQMRGRQIHFNKPGTDGFRCIDCHAADREQGFFGANGLVGVIFLNESDKLQAMKVPHLRNLYTKVGLFESGDQVRGFGFLHDGATSTLLEFFLQSNVAVTQLERIDVARFVLAYDSELAPIVGQQATVSVTANPLAPLRVVLLQERAMLRECDLIARGHVDGEQRGYLMDPSGMFRPDRIVEQPLSLGELNEIAHTAGQALTFTCAPPLSGTRMGLDRDEDGSYDTDELDAGSDPADPLSTPSDIDGDGWPNVGDNCTVAANADQRDTDEDGFGNICDADLNDDCIVDLADLKAMREVLFSADPDADLNGDGTVDSADLDILKDGLFRPPGPSGVENLCDALGG